MRRAAPAPAPAAGQHITPPGLRSTRPGRRSPGSLTTTPRVLRTTLYPNLCPPAPCLTRLQVPPSCRGGQAWNWMAHGAFPRGRLMSPSPPGLRRSPRALFRTTWRFGHLEMHRNRHSGQPPASGGPGDYAYAISRAGPGPHRPSHRHTPISSIPLVSVQGYPMPPDPHARPERSPHPHHDEAAPLGSVAAMLYRPPGTAGTLHSLLRSHPGGINQAPPGAAKQAWMVTAGQSHPRSASRMAVRRWRPRLAKSWPHAYG